MAVTLQIQKVTSMALEEPPPIAAQVLFGVAISFPLYET
jgi:hypothetical protein